MQSLLRTAKFPGSPSVLITAGEVVLPKIYGQFNVTHFQEAKAMPRNYLLEEIPKHEALYCLVCIIFYYIFKCILYSFFKTIQSLKFVLILY